MPASNEVPNTTQLTNEKNAGNLNTSASMQPAPSNDILQWSSIKYYYKIKTANLSDFVNNYCPNWGEISARADLAVVPTVAPNTPTASSTSACEAEGGTVACHYSATWTNNTTQAGWWTETEWFINNVSQGVQADGNVTTSDALSTYGNMSGAQAVGKIRARYASTAGAGPWSAYSNNTTPPNRLCA